VIVEYPARKGVAPPRERAFMIPATFEHGRRLGYFKSVARPDPAARRPSEKPTDGRRQT